MIAALYVQTGGCYFGLPNVDPWDVHRDARKYDGPWPVVAHPPLNWRATFGTHQIGLFEPKKPELPKAERAATPIPFRDLLISIAETANCQREAA